MKFRNKLKYRIIIAFLALSTLLGVLFATTALTIRQHLSTNLIGESIKLILDDYMDKFAKDPNGTQGEPMASNVLALVTTPENLPLDLPISYADLKDGIHNIRENGKQYKVAVNKRHIIEGKEVWGYIKFDVTVPKNENRLVYSALAGVFVLFSIIAYFLAIYASKKILKPLRHLASMVGQQNKKPQQLASHFSDDEVGQLAKALDDYSDRLTDVVNRDKEFNADVSHELRTPLAVIASTAELILSQPNIDDKTKLRLARIERAVKQSAELTETLLLLVREEQKTDANLQRTQVGKLVKEIIENFSATIKLKKLTVEVIEDDWLQVRAPSAVISVALSNLIGNAIKYTPKGTIQIILKDDRVLVIDQGTGVGKDELPKLFDRHYRGSSVTAKGSGLGLAIVKRLCELYNWKVIIHKNDTSGLTAELISLQ
ncbi:MAG: HAMP domain-containing histidine kinase [Alcanivoracaceae bacterium]|nr:HAMP domain-containing histidine kinase [Alcanivoracaceae bacterium]